MKKHICLVILILIASTLSSNAETIYFEDNFDGTSLDYSKWNNDHAVTGNRWCSIDQNGVGSGVWLNYAVESCYGTQQSTPYGEINLSSGAVTFSSSNIRTFPFILTGPSARQSPFPVTGDFSFEVRLKFNQINGSGSGLRIRDWDETDPSGDNPPAESDGPLFQVWADSTSMRIWQSGQRVIVPKSTDYHTYRLDYSSGAYSVYMDNSLIAGPTPSTLRPNSIWIGNPMAVWFSTASWTRFSIDYIKIYGEDRHLINPSQPTYNPIPPTTHELNMVVLTHGWNSSKEAWATDAENAIKNAINTAYEAGNLNTRWGVYSYDWSDEAKGTPDMAYAHAKDQGKALAEELLGFDAQFVHFIAHSAGSDLIYNAAKKLKKENPSIKIHSTFLDAYTSVRKPFSRYKKYGKYSDWSEQYMDSRPLGYLFFGIAEIEDTTDTLYRRLTNFDVTVLDPDASLLSVDFHAWPYEFYRTTINSSSSCNDVGFPLSFESGKQGKTKEEWLNSIQQRYPCTGTNCKNLAVIPQCNPTTAWGIVEDVVTAVYEKIKDNITTEESSTGNILLYPGLTGFELQTGSPVWVKVNFSIDKPIDLIKFDYQYLSNAEGLLNVYFDNQLVYVSDERVAEGVTETALDIPLAKEAQPGEHFIVFRLDNFDINVSKIRIENIELGQLIVTSFPWPMFLPAITGQK